MVIKATQSDGDRRSSLLGQRMGNDRLQLEVERPQHFPEAIRCSDQSSEEGQTYLRPSRDGGREMAGSHRPASRWEKSDRRCPCGEFLGRGPKLFEQKEGPCPDPHVF